MGSKIRTVHTLRNTPRRLGAIAPIARWPTGAPRTADEPRDVLVLRLIPAHCCLESHHHLSRSLALGQLSDFETHPVPTQIVANPVRLSVERVPVSRCVSRFCWDQVLGASGRFDEKPDPSPSRCCLVTDPLVLIMRNRLWSSHLVGLDRNLGSDAERNPIIFNHGGDGVIFLNVNSSLATLRSDFGALTGAVWMCRTSWPTVHTAGRSNSGGSTVTRLPWASPI